MSGGTSYLYIPNTYKGHRPANRQTVEVYDNGAIVAVPTTTTMHFDMIAQMRQDVDLARADARFHGAGQLLFESTKAPTGGWD